MEQITLDEFKKVKLQVGEIKEVKDHPNADKLYILLVDLGTQTLQLVAGVKPYYKKEELLGKQIVVVSNLIPINIRGVESQGMLLAGLDENTLAIITPERKLKLGSIIR